MNAGVICFADKDSAIHYQKHQNEEIVAWKMFQAISCSPDTNISATLSLQGLDPQTVILKKNQIVEWTFTGKGFRSQIDLTLRGYEEFGSISIPADGKPVKYKILASRPGTGFAFFTNDGRNYHLEWSKFQAPHHRRRGGDVSHAIVLIALQEFTLNRRNNWVIASCCHVRSFDLFDILFRDGHIRVLRVSGFLTNFD